MTFFFVVIPDKGILIYHKYKRRKRGVGREEHLAVLLLVTS